MCRLKKALYRLKQSPRDWFEKFRDAIINNGYKKTQANHTLFVKNQGRKVMALIVYVNNILVISNDQCETKGLRDYLGK